MILSLEPGPTSVDPRVVQAMAQPTIHHLSAEFEVSLDRAAALLARLFGTESEVVVLPATGRGGVEAVFTSLTQDGRGVVVATNGFFGRMMAAIARSTGAHVVEVEHQPGEPLAIDRIRHVLAVEDIGLLALVHCETSTGMLNPMADLADAAHDHDALLFVDAVSSLGGVAVDMDALDIDVCVSAGQKAVGAIGGVSFAAMRARARAVMDSRSEHARGSYLDLDNWWAQWLPADRGGRMNSGYRRLPWSMPSQPMAALLEACRLAVECEGMDDRFRRHAAAGAATRAVLAELELRLLPAEVHASPTVTAFLVPAAEDAVVVVERLSKRHGVVLAAGMGDMRHRVLRIGHMAETARPAPLLQALAAVETELAGPNGTKALSSFLPAWTASATSSSVYPRPPM